jgi:hypothetical protein
MTNQPCSAVAERRWQRSSGSISDAAAAAVVTMTTIKMKVRQGRWQLGSSALVAEADARRRWQRQLDHPPHDLTPLPTQAGEDAVGVNPTPAATTTLFGSGFSQPTNCKNDQPILQCHGRALAAARRWQQKRGAGSSGGNDEDYENEGAVVAVAAWRQHIGSRGGSAAAVAAAARPSTS